MAFDVSLLGLKHELIAFLAEHDVVWFSDFSQVEVDMGNRELKIELSCSYDRVKTPLAKFARRHGFTTVFHYDGAVYMRRG